MKIKITGTPKEIAALVMALRERQKETGIDADKLARQKYGCATVLSFNYPANEAIGDIPATCRGNM